MKLHTRISRTLSLLLLMTFLPGLVRQESVILFAAPVQSQSPAEKLSFITIPEEMGRVEEWIPGRSGRTVIYIQDAHDSLEAQENIAKIIEHLVKTAGVRTVFEEGYEGPVPTEDYFGFITDSVLREKTAHFFLDKLRLGGAEYAAVVSGKSTDGRRQSAEKINELENNLRGLSTVDGGQSFVLIGADNLKLQKENIRQYQRAVHFQKINAAQIQMLKKEMEILGQKFFPRQIKELLKLRERLDQNLISPLDYFNRLEKIEAADKGERGKGKSGFPSALTPLPSAVEFLQSIQALEDSIVRQFLSDPVVRQIFEYHRELTLLLRLNQLQLSLLEFEFVKKVLIRVNTQQLADFIAKTGKKSVALPSRWEKDLKPALKFYEIAKAREGAVDQALRDYSMNVPSLRGAVFATKQSADRGLLRPVLDRARNDEENASFVSPSVLVFGGFHKEGIKEILRQRGDSILIVTPKISAPDPKHQAYYKQLMSVGHHDFEKPFLPGLSNRPESVIQRRALTEVVAVYSQILANPDLDPAFFDRHLMGPSAARSEMREDEFPSTQKVSDLKSIQERLKRESLLGDSPIIYEVETIPVLSELNAFIQTMGFHPFNREPAFYGIHTEKGSPKLLAVFSAPGSKEINLPSNFSAWLNSHPEQVLFEVHSHTLAGMSTELEYLFPSPLDFLEAQRSSFPRYLYSEKNGLVQFGFTSKERPQAESVVVQRTPKESPAPVYFTTSFAASGAYLYFGQGDELNPLGVTAYLFKEAIEKKGAGGKVLAEDANKNYALWNPQVTLENLLRLLQSGENTKRSETRNQADIPGQPLFVFSEQEKLPNGASVFRLRTAGSEERLPVYVPEKFLQTMKRLPENVRVNVFGSQVIEMIRENGAVKMRGELGSGDLDLMLESPEPGLLGNAYAQLRADQKASFHQRDEFEYVTAGPFTFSRVALTFVNLGSGEIAAAFAGEFPLIGDSYRDLRTGRVKLDTGRMNATQSLLALSYQLRYGMTLSSQARELAAEMLKPGRRDWLEDLSDNSYYLRFGKFVSYAPSLEALKKVLLENNLPETFTDRALAEWHSQNNARKIRGQAGEKTEQRSEMRSKGVLMINADTLIRLDAAEKAGLFSQLYSHQGELRLGVFNEHGQIPSDDAALNAIVGLSSVKWDPHSSYEAAVRKLGIPNQPSVLLFPPEEKLDLKKSPLIKGVPLKDNPGVFAFARELALSGGKNPSVEEKDGVFDPPGELLSALVQETFAVAYSA